MKNHTDALIFQLAICGMTVCDQNLTVGYKALYSHRQGTI